MRRSAESPLREAIISSSSFWRLLSRRSFRRTGSVFLIGTEELLDVAVKIQEAARAGGRLNAIYQLSGPRFFLHLLLDEPVHQHLGWIIPGSHGRLVNGIDPTGVGLLHRLRLFHHFQQ